MLTYVSKFEEKQLEIIFVSLAEPELHEFFLRFCTLLFSLIVSPRAAIEKYKYWQTMTALCVIFL